MKKKNSNFFNKRNKNFYSSKDWYLTYIKKMKSVKVEDFPKSPTMTGIMAKLDRNNQLEKSGELAKNSKFHLIKFPKITFKR